MISSLHTVRLIVLSGPSGVGKKVLIDKLIQDFPHKFERVITHTTRQPRKNEIPGLHYHFTPREQMENQIKNGDFIESVEICGELYGLTIQAIRDAIFRNKTYLVTLNVQGCEKIKSKAKELNLEVRCVFIAPPSIEELAQRWNEKENNSSQNIELLNIRMKVAKSELVEYNERMELFDEIIIGTSLEHIYTKLKQFLKNEIESETDSLQTLKNTKESKRNLSPSIDEDSLDSLDKSVLNLLFPHKKGKFDPLYAKYLSELTSYNLDKIVDEERVRLKQEEEKIQREMEELAYKNYKTFIQISECTLTVKRQLSILDIKLDNLLKGMTSLSNACQEFCTRSTTINANNNVVKMTLKQHPTLLELLELPQLLTTCVKSQYYEEAMSLQQFAIGLYREYSNIPIIVDIYNEVQSIMETMVVQLHQQLCQNIPLSQYSRVIGYLKRLGIYTEKELRFCFLYCRDINFNNTLNGIPFANPYTYLTKLVDVCRTHMSEIITQYRTIFDTEEDIRSEQEDGGILYGWVTEKISQFLRRMERTLKNINDGSSLLNVLNQCMYFGASLARMGFDFRGLLSPIFEEGVLSLFTNFLNVTKQQFCIQLKRLPLYLSSPISVSANSNLSITTITTITTTTTTSDSGDSPISPQTEDSNKLKPPTLLLDFVPLALLVNGVLTAFNEVRKCCIPTLQERLGAELISFLSFVMEEIIRFKSSKEYSQLNQTEKEHFRSFCRILAEEVVPYLSECFSALFYSPHHLISNEKIASFEKFVQLYEKSHSLHPQQQSIID